jgi:hypothetical protein
MEFVTIGNAGNAADTAGEPINAGAVNRHSLYRRCCR